MDMTCKWGREGSYRSACDREASESGYCSDHEWLIDVNERIDRWTMN